jgi:hypothetical protein
MKILIVLHSWWEKSRLHRQLAAIERQKKAILARNQQSEADTFVSLLRRQTSIEAQLQGK